MDKSEVNPKEGTIRIERLLPGPIERVWSYLTDSELRSTWFAAGDMGGGVGSEVEFDMRHNRITTDEPPVEKYRGVHFAGISWKETILAMEAPRLLRFTWTGEDEEHSEVTFELIPEGSKVRLKLTHNRVPDVEQLADFASGWHAHFDALTARLRGREVNNFWANWAVLRDAYEKMAQP